MSPVTRQPPRPPEEARRLIHEAHDAKREAQRLERLAAHNLREAERICRKFGIDFRVLRQDERTAQSDERHGHPTATAT